MSQGWIIAIVVCGVVALAFVGAWLGRRLWLRRVRRLLIVLFSRTEAVASAVRSLRELMSRMADANDAVWVGFVEDGGSEERRALAEIAHRTDVVAVELANTPLPKVLHELADDIEALSRDIRDVTMAVDRARDVHAVLDTMGAIPLSEIAGRLRDVERKLNRLEEEFDVTDPAVYGGGLYI
jgi:hypothetical protein